MFVYQESTFPQHGKCGFRACLSLGGERIGGDRDRRSLRRGRGTGQSNHASSLALLLLLCLLVREPRRVEHLRQDPKPGPTPRNRPMRQPFLVSFTV